MIAKTIIDPKIKCQDPEELIKEPVVIRLTKFNEEGNKEFSKQLSEAHNTGQPVVPVIVDSYGGQVYTMLGIISEMQNSELPIATIIKSKAMSAGAMIFCMGTEGYRFMAPHATLMIHEVFSFGMGKVKEIKASAAETERLNDYAFKLIATHLGKEPDFFLKKIHEESHADWYLDAQKAKEIGLSNHTRIPKLITEIKLTTRFE